MVFSEQQLNKVDEIIRHYPEGKQKSAILTHIAFSTTARRWMA